MNRGMSDGMPSPQQPLRKPELPKQPKAKVHGRSNVGAGKEFPDQAAFEAAKEAWREALRLRPEHPVAAARLEALEGR